MSGERGASLLVLGAGALGCAIGGTLADAGRAVVLVSRRVQHVAAIEAHGLRMSTPTGDRVVPLRARTSCAGLAPVDTLLVLVKSADTATAIASAAPAIAPHTLVVTLQNGLGNEELLADAVGPERVIAGRTWVGGQLLGPGRVFAQVDGQRTLVGELDGRRSARVERLAGEWTAAGVPVEVSDRIRGVIWDKLMTNVATGAVSAVTGLPLGGLYAVPALARVGRAAVAEAQAVARAAGVDLQVGDPESVWLAAGAGRPDDFFPSMGQSIQDRRRTEVDAINGAVCRWGARLGVPTPVNDTLWAAVQGRERAVLAAPPAPPAPAQPSAEHGDTGMPPG